MRKVARSPALIVVGFMLLQAAWILTIPPFRGIDEIDHTYRAAAVARGQWVAGEAAEDGRGEQVRVPASIVTAANAQCEQLTYTGHDNCNATRSEDDGVVVVASSAGSYYPPFYWVVGTTALPFDGATALFAMRISAAFLCSLFIGLAVWSLRRVPSRWPMVALVLAATPVLIYSTTVVAPNGLEMSAALTLWAALLALVRQPQQNSRLKLVLVAIVAAVVLGSLRALGPAFILLIVGTVAVLEPRALWSAVRRHPRVVALGCVLVGAAVAIFAAWTAGAVVSVLESDEVEDRSGFKPINLVMWAMQSIAAFPFRDQQGPLIIYPVIGTLVILLVVTALRRGTRRERIAMSLGIGLTAAIPIAFTLATLHSVGDIWQGRYGMPYGVGVLLIAGVVLSRRQPEILVPKLLAPLAGLLYAVAVTACLLKVRSDELAHNDASVADPAWHEPSPLLLGVLVVAATALIVAGLLGAPGGTVVRASLPEYVRGSKATI